MIKLVTVKYTGANTDKEYFYYTKRDDIKADDEIQVPLGSRTKTAVVVNVFKVGEIK